MRILSVLVLLACAVLAGETPKAVNGLSLQAWMESEFASVGALPFRVTLYNASGAELRYALEGERPPLEFRLERKGAPAVHKPLPADLEVYRTPGRLVAGGHAFSMRGDLRRVFGKLEPGRYTLKIVHAAKGYRTDVKGFAAAEIHSAPHAFEVIETSVDEARRNSPASKDVAMRLVVEKDGPRVVRVTNLGRRALRFFAYTVDEREPLDSLVMVETWTGRRWTGAGGGFCGTGLVPVQLHAGQTRDLTAPPVDEGIVRLVLDFAGADEKPVRVVSEPFLAGK